MKTEIKVEGGIGNVWQIRDNCYGWSHPNGSQGEASTFESAVEALEAI